MKTDERGYETTQEAEEAGKQNAANSAAGGFVVRVMGDGSIRVVSYERVNDRTQDIDPGGVDPEAHTASLHAWQDGAWHDRYLGLPDDAPDYII